MTTKLSYEQAIDAYAFAMLHETGRQTWPFWALLSNSQKLKLWDEMLMTLLLAEEYEKVADIQDEIDKIKAA